MEIDEDVYVCVALSKCLHLHSRIQVFRKTTAIIRVICPAMGSYWPSTNYQALKRKDT